MNTRQRNTLYMLKSVEKFLTLYESTWKVEAKMVSLVEEFHEKKERIVELFAEKEKLAEPYSKVKKVHRKDYARKVAQLAGILYSIGDEKDMDDLKLYSDITQNKLLGGSSQYMFSNAKKVIDLARENLEFIKEFSVGEELFNNCIALTEAISENELNPYDRRDLVKSLNANIKDAIDDIKAFLDRRLDRVVLLFQGSNPQFIRDYKGARVILKLPATRGVSDESGDPAPDTADDETVDPLEDNAEVPKGDTSKVPSIEEDTLNDVEEELEEFKESDSQDSDPPNSALDGEEAA